MPHCFPLLAPRQSPKDSPLHCLMEFQYYQLPYFLPNFKSWTTHKGRLLGTLILTIIILLVSLCGILLGHVPGFAPEVLSLPLLEAPLFWEVVWRRGFLTCFQATYSLVYVLRASILQWCFFRWLRWAWVLTMPNLPASKTNEFEPFILNLPNPPIQSEFW